MDTSNKPPFDEPLAKSYIGRYVLIGITYYDSAGIPVKHEQMHGTIGEVSSESGIRVDLKGKRDGQAKWFPPDIRSLMEANAGEYSLRETGEVIVNPDLLWTWNVTMPTDQ